MSAMMNQHYDTMNYYDHQHPSPSDQQYPPTIFP
jgi:hypothetical protein